MSKPACAALVVLLFVIEVSAAQLCGRWHNAISPQEYRGHLAHLDHPAYQHNRGTVPAYDWDELGISNAATVNGGRPSADQRRSPGQRGPRAGSGD